MNRKELLRDFQTAVKDLDNAETAWYTVERKMENELKKKVDIPEWARLYNIRVENNLITWDVVDPHDNDKFDYGSMTIGEFYMEPEYYHQEKDRILMLQAIAENEKKKAKRKALYEELKLEFED